jgi:hypothetical protein
MNVSFGVGEDGTFGGGEGGSWTGRSRLDALSTVDVWAPDLKRTP